MRGREELLTCGSHLLIRRIIHNYPATSEKKAYQTIEGFDLHRFSIMEEALYPVL
jgi:hypothetical protein